MRKPLRTEAPVELDEARGHAAADGTAGQPHPHERGLAREIGRRERSAGDRRQRQLRQRLPLPPGHAHRRAARLDEGLELRLVHVHDLARLRMTAKELRHARLPRHDREQQVDGVVRKAEVRRNALAPRRRARRLDLVLHVPGQREEHLVEPGRVLLFGPAQATAVPQIGEQHASLACLQHRAHLGVHSRLHGGGVEPDDLCDANAAHESDRSNQGHVRVYGA